MASECDIGHSPVIDSVTATLVCNRCCRVLDERLSYSEVNETGFSAIATPFLQTEEKEEIFGEPVIEVLRKIGDKLHLPQSCINNSYTRYCIIKEKVKKILSANPRAKNKRSLLSNENILGYSLYNLLKEESCARSIKEICYYLGIKKSLSILKIEKYLELNRNRIKPVQRVKPITARDIILTNYLYLENFVFEDVKEIFHRLNCIEPINFSPATTSAGAVYLYMNYVKGCKKTMTQITSLFNVQPMSIQRFVNKYKNYF